MMTPMLPVMVPGIGNDFTGRSSNIIAAGGGNRAHRDNDRLFGIDKLDFVVNFLRRTNTTTRRINPQNHRLDAVIIAKVVELLDDLPGISDDPIDFDNTDLVAESKGGGTPHEAGDSNGQGQEENEKACQKS